MAFNSLHAQRESCLNYVRSQAHEGWIALDDEYNDPAFSGGNRQRPALQRLLHDIGAGRVDAVVCYRIDRLTRALTDFARLVDVFEQNNISLVSITESFNTATERIRDKFLASRRRGMWMGGHPPLGYDVGDRKLAINAGEAELVQHVFRRFLQVGSATKLAQELNAAGH